MDGVLVNKVDALKQACETVGKKSLSTSELQTA